MLVLYTFGVKGYIMSEKCKQLVNRLDQLGFGLTVIRDVVEYCKQEGVNPSLNDTQKLIDFVENILDHKAGRGRKVTAQTERQCPS